MNEPTLVVLAAGIGSRYGGVKQIDRVGARGETLLEYSVYDALASGFGRVVFVIRHSIADDFRDVVLSRMEGIVDYALCYQELDSLIDPINLERSKKCGRSKPWGTAHALLCAANELRSPFAVINADDFYGRSAFRAMGNFLSHELDANEGAIAAYRLKDTLSPAGSVSRGVCRTECGYLAGVEEHLSIQGKAGRIYAEREDGSFVELAPDTPVSMNFWGFPLSAIGGIEAYFRSFLGERADKPKAECYLPAAVDALVRDGPLRMRVVEARSAWFGMTYREDRESSAKRITELTDSGEYPSPLWSRS